MMKNCRKYVLAAALLASIASFMCSEEIDGVSGATEDEVDLAFERESFAMTKEMRASPTGWGGSKPVQKLELNPELKILFAGNGFSKDYLEDRGHIWAMTDLKNSGRITGKTPASCLVCKTPYVSELYKKSGWAFASQPVTKFFSEDHPTISCETCHEPQNKRLRVIQPAFVESLAARKIDFKALSQKEKSILTCAQCHVEYYMVPGTNQVVHPLSFGNTAESMYAYYQTEPNGFKADFVHPVSGTPVLKAQHPDYEDFLGGVHAQAGLTCAECHMPEGSHQVTSPLHTVEKSCLKCHTGKTADWLISRVRYNQDTLAALQTQCGQDLARTHLLLGEKAAKLSPAVLEKAQQGLREAQWYWDYVAASNSMGAHNPVGGLKNLSVSLRLASSVRELILTQ